MFVLLIVHLAAALAAPSLVKRLGRRAFVFLAVVPASAAVWAVTQTSLILSGEYPSSTRPWIPSLGLDFSFRLDNLSWLLVLMVGGIGAAVLIYCTRYFARGSTGLGRFAAEFVGFAGAMFGLVTSDNLISFYVFWELTTVFSYLLIGHYSDRASSRRAAMKAILVTTLGGLAMLVGVVLLGNEAGTYRISQIVADPPTGGLVDLAIVLLLLGAVTKSALIPFHFWLPAAMAAPTPVSAYLHAAAMVKAGVYLVARFAPGFSTLPSWQAIVAVLGAFTLVFAGYRALRQNDLKLLLAFGTISQLGLLIILVGSPYQAVALAGLALLGAHALFKACLFLVVGIIDAVTGTRDLRRLSGLGQMMPVTAVIAALAVASMIGLGPFAGFVAKEAALSALLDPAVDASLLKWPLVGALVVGSILTVAYGIRFWWGAFATKRGAQVYPVAIARPPVLLIGPPAIMALAGLVVALVPAAGEAILGLYASEYPLGEPGHLAIWSGLNPALLVTVVILVLGAGLFFVSNRGPILQLRWPDVWDGDRVYRHTLRRIDRLAADITSLYQRGSLPLYLGVILITMVTLVGAAILSAGLVPSLQSGSGPNMIGIAVLVVAATVLATRARRRLKAVILAGITGYGTALIFLLYGAPDLALTQVLVETVSLVFFVLVMRRLPAYFSNRPAAASRWVRLGIGVSVGVLVAALALLVPQTRVHAPVSELFADEAVSFGGGRNVVNVTLVDIRAWDTMGEISVLLVAATGVASLIFIHRRNAERSEADEFEESAEPIGASDPDPVAPLRSRGSARDGPSSRAKWLVAGATLAPQRRSVILEVATRILFHTMIVFAVFLLFSGHNAPGGGFVAGLVTGVALILRYLAGGRYELSAATPLQPRFLLGGGLFIAVAVGVLSMMFGGAVLQSVIVEWDMPVLGHIKLVSSIFFDFGVYLVVVGLMLDVLRSLGAEIDRHGEASGDDSEFVGPALEPATPLRRRPL